MSVASRGAVDGGARWIAVALACVAVLVACNPSPATKTGATSDPASSTAIVSAPPAGDTRAAADAEAPTATASEETSAPDARAERRHLEMVEANADSDALSLIRAKRLEAKAAGRVLVVYVGATWCAPCKRFKAEVTSGRLDDRLGGLTLLAFDADRDGDRLGAAGYSYQFVPFVALPGADGHPAVTQQATGKGSEAWRELLGKLDAWRASAGAR